MARKYRQGMESGEMPEKDPNSEMSRRDWIKFLIGAGAIGGLIYVGAKQLIDHNPRSFEKWCNEVMRKNNDPDAVENIEERIARYKKELEERVEYATPISTFDELDKVRRNLGGNYKLACDIVCPQGHNWEPIGDYKNPFAGTFNGKGFTIENLSAIWPERDYVGMFGYVGKGESTQIKTITDLKLKNVNVKGRFYIGKLVGYNLRGLIINCHTDGEIIGKINVGGLVGISHGILLKSSDNGIVEGEKLVGGLVSYNSNGYIINCLPNEKVKGNKCIGTLIGHNYVCIDYSDNFSEHIINSPGTIGIDTSPKK